MNMLQYEALVAEIGKENIFYASKDSVFIYIFMYLDGQKKIQYIGLDSGQTYRALATFEPAREYRMLSDPSFDTPIQPLTEFNHKLYKKVYGE
ncbi:MAG: hypothetical protein GY776_07025 [Alteromonas sp.]|nr:hypothetical protein [Alteromonas sp.]